VEWSQWLKARSTSQIDPPPMGAAGFMPLCDAPGNYVLER
jgi:polyhydroxyalkanoate synthase